MCAFTDATTHTCVRTHAPIYPRLPSHTLTCTATQSPYSVLVAPGTVLHFAPGNPLPEARMAYCVSYVADGARLLQREGHLRYPDGEDYPSYQAWVEEVGWGEAARHPLLPLVYTEVDPEAG